MTQLRYGSLIGLFSLFTLFSLHCQFIAPSQPPQIDTILSQMDFNRTVTERLLDEIEKTGQSAAVLRWSVGDHAPIGWHIMHLASTEDRFAAMLGAPGLVSEEYAERFRSGKEPARDIPSLKEVRKYLKASRTSLVSALSGFDLSRIKDKPAVDAPFNFETVILIIGYHEPHHHGQAHATFNLYKER